MPPEITGVLYENDEEVSSETIQDVQNKDKYQELPIIWDTLIKIVISHAISIYGLYLAFTSAKWLTLCYVIVNYVIGVLGNAAGVHRLWSHRSYKAKWPLRLFLAYGQTQNFHMDIIYWTRFHRNHHKYTETNADPTNAKRGLYFSHIGWVYREQTPEFKEKYKTVDVSDLYEDPISRYQEKYYMSLVLLICFIIPTTVPIYFWNETFLNAFSINFLRYTLNLHSFCIGNSFAHTFGNKPYEKSIASSENFLVSLFMFGEGWHNFHHTFPWDYRGGETGQLNIATDFINLMEKCGLAYDLKTVSSEMIKRRVLRSGDGSHTLWGSKAHI